MRSFLAASTATSHSDGRRSANSGTTADGGSANAPTAADLTSRVVVHTSSAAAAHTTTHTGIGTGTSGRTGTIPVRTSTAATTATSALLLSAHLDLHVAIERLRALRMLQRLLLRWQRRTTLAAA
ncbi:MAG: hypothetical protein WBP59_11965, partial [Ilumatobacteraceae bacterium]